MRRRLRDTAVCLGLAMGATALGVWLLPTEVAWENMARCLASWVALLA